MGLFGWGRKRRSAPAPSDEATKDRQLRREFLIEGYRSGNPNALEAARILSGRGGAKIGSGQAPFEQKMLERLVDRGMQPPPDPTETLLKQFELFRMFKEQQGGGDEGGGILGKALAAAAAILVQSPVGQQLIGQGGQVAAAPIVTPPPATPAMLPGPAPYAGLAPSPGVVGEPPAMQGTAVPIDMNAFSAGQVLDHLENDEPPDFAAWLLAHPRGADIAQMLIEADPDQVLQHLHQQVQHPLAPAHAMYPVAIWLLQHPDRAVAVMVSVRQQFVSRSAGVQSGTDGNNTIYGTPMERPDQRSAIGF